MKKKLVYEYKCECGIGRGDVPQVEKESDLPQHECPYALLVRGDIRNTASNCRCCKSCTILCLPTKILRDNKDIDGIFTCFIEQENDGGSETTSKNN